jgi:hypothetical protein
MQMAINLQTHDSPIRHHRNWVAILAIFPLILFLGTRNLSATVECVILVVLMMLPAWLWLGRDAKSIRTTSEGLDIKRYNNATVHIPWTDLVRTEIQPPDAAGSRYVDIYSRTTRPVRFRDCISGYDDLMAEIRRHLNGDVEDAEAEWLASARKLSNWERLIGGFLVVCSIIATFALTIGLGHYGSILDIATWPSPMMEMALLWGEFAILLIPPVVLSRITRMPAALRRPFRKLVTLATPVFAILFALGAAKLRTSNPHMAALFLVSGVVSCTMGVLMLRMLKER